METVGVQRFGAFELDSSTGELRHNGTAVKLQPQPYRVLALLVERAGELVTREELQKALWGEDTYVDFERGLNFCVNQVRAALGDSAESPQFIQTLFRRGYRFIAPVSGSDQGQSTSTNRLKVPGRSSQFVARAGPYVAGIAFLTLLAAGATFVAGTVRRTGPAPSGRTMIAVLPLEDLTGDPAPPWFADGLTDELIAQIGRVSPGRLGVIARTSAMTYRGTGKRVGDIGRELGVSHVVEGSVRREGTRLRVTVQLVTVGDQSPIWSDTYERSLHGTLTIQSEIAAHVARALALELVPAGWATPTWSGTRDPDARDALLRAKYALHRATVDDLRAALAHTDDAIARDPAFAAAYATQTDVLHLHAMFGLMPSAEAYERARPAAARALHLDPDLAEAHAAMGLVELWGNWNAAAAAASFERAMRINPSDAAAHHDYAWAFVALQQFDRAAAHITRARELDPLSPRASSDIGWLYLQIRQPTEALRACRQTLALDPDSVEAQQCLERAHLQRGEFADALTAARAAAARRGAAMPAALDGSSPEAQVLDLWRWRLQRLQSAAAERYVSPYTIAMHHAVLGHDEEALASLEAAYRAKAAPLVLLRTDPVFDGLRDRPRFQDLIERIAR